MRCLSSPRFILPIDKYRIVRFHKCCILKQVININYFKLVILGLDETIGPI